MIWIGWYAMLLFLSFTWLFEIKKNTTTTALSYPNPTTTKQKIIFKNQKNEHN